MSDKDEVKVTVGKNHTPSAATIAVAESLKNDGNALLAGELVVHVVCSSTSTRRRERGKMSKQGDR